MYYKAFIKKYNDKILHFCIGFIIGALCFPLKFYAIAVGLFFGILKELYDLKDYGRFDFIDLLWTIIGSSIFPITWWFYNYTGLC